MYEMLEGRHPFWKKKMTQEDVKNKLKEFKKIGYEQVLTKDLDIDKVALDLLSQLLHSNKS